MAQYEVIVGNIGTVYSGDKLGLAIKCYSDYRKLSKRDIGRASNESVVMFKDGEILHEHEGKGEDNGKKVE